jgi:hypothetical protein
MRKELDDLLCQRYPAIFSQRNASFEISGMGKGFECGDGWFDLIDALCECLQFWTDHNDREPQVEARQVKEKFGTLRFHCSGANERQRGMIDMAVSMSGRICEECGAPGKIVGYRICCPAHGSKEVDSGQE